MKKEKPQTKVIDLKIADATDEELKAILEVRKKYSIDERNTLIKGLVYIAQTDGEYSAFEKEVVESTACTLGINKQLFDELSDEIGGKTVEPEQRLIKVPFLVGIQFMFGNIDYFLLMDAFIEANQGRKWREEFCSVLLAHLGVLPAEHVSVVNWTVTENDVSIAGNRW